MEGLLDAMKRVIDTEPMQSNCVEAFVRYNHAIQSCAMHSLARRHQVAAPQIHQP